MLAAPYQPVEKRGRVILSVASPLVGDAEHRIAPPTRDPGAPGLHLFNGLLGFL